MFTKAPLAVLVVGNLGFPDVVFSYVIPPGCLVLLGLQLPLPLAMLLVPLHAAMAFTPDAILP